MAMRGSGGIELTWCVRLFPFIEQTALADIVDWNVNYHVSQHPVYAGADTGLRVSFRRRGRETRERRGGVLLTRH